MRRDAARVELSGFSAHLSAAMPTNLNDHMPGSTPDLRGGPELLRTATTPPDCWAPASRPAELCGEFTSSQALAAARPSWREHASGAAASQAKRQDPAAAGLAVQLAPAVHRTAGM